MNSLTLFSPGFFTGVRGGKIRGSEEKERVSLEYVPMLALGLAKGYTLFQVALCSLVLGSRSYTLVSSDLKGRGSPLLLAWR